MDVEWRVYGMEGAAAAFDRHGQHTRDASHFGASDF